MGEVERLDDGTVRIHFDPDEMVEVCLTACCNQTGADCHCPGGPRYADAEGNRLQAAYEHHRQRRNAANN
jgi:hypothetical protein